MSPSKCDKQPQLSLYVMQAWLDGTMDPPVLTLDGTRRFLTVCVGC
jgi:hypothetical protein